MLSKNDLIILCVFVVSFYHDFSASLSVDYVLSAIKKYLYGDVEVATSRKSNTTIQVVYDFSYNIILQIQFSTWEWSSDQV